MTPFTKAIGYTRTSSAANVGEGKDSETRQRQSIQRHAAAFNLIMVDWFNDPAVSGADPLESRPGFAALLARIATDDVRTIIVETSNRFARDLMVQEIGFAKLKELGVTLIAADSPTAFLDDTPTAKLIRQLLGAVAEFDKAMTVAKLKGARDRKRLATGKCEGRKSHAEMRPDVVEHVRRLHLSGATLRRISEELFQCGHVNIHGVPYAAASIRSMLGSNHGA